jgi:hypothetical protein
MSQHPYHLKELIIAYKFNFFLKRCFYSNAWLIIASAKLCLIEKFLAEKKIFQLCG